MSGKRERMPVEFNTHFMSPKSGISPPFFVASSMLIAPTSNLSTLSNLSFMNVIHVLSVLTSATAGLPTLFPSGNLSSHAGSHTKKKSISLFCSS